MAYTLFNTLEYVKLLRNAGFNEQQAEGLNEAQMIATQSVLSQVATQNDLERSQVATQRDIHQLRTEMQMEFHAVRSEMKQEFQAVRSEMQLEFKQVRVEIQEEIAQIKPFVLKAVISTMLANFALMGIGVAVLALNFA